MGAGIVEITHRRTFELLFADLCEPVDSFRIVSAQRILISQEAQGSGFACCIAHLSRQVQALGQGTFRHPIVVRAVLFVELKSHFIFRFKRSASPDLFTKRREMLLLHHDIFIGQGNLPIQNVVDRIQVIGVNARRQDKQPANGNNVLCFHFGGSSWID